MSECGWSSVSNVSSYCRTFWKYIFILLLYTFVNVITLYIYIKIRVSPIVEIVCQIFPSYGCNVSHINRINVRMWLKLHVKCSTQIVVRSKVILSFCSSTCLQMLLLLSFAWQLRFLPSMCCTTSWQLNCLSTCHTTSKQLGFILNSIIVYRQNTTCSR